MTRKEAIKILSNRDGHGIPSGYNGGYAEAIDLAIEALKADPKKIFYDGYAYCLMDFGRDTVLCRDCKHYKQSAVTDRKMCFRKDVDGVEVCYDFQPYDSCTYGERRNEVEDDNENT